MPARISRVLCVGLIAMCASGLFEPRAAEAQFPSEKVSLYSQIDLATFAASSGNDCWGYTSPSGREYALMSVRNKVAFVEITVPTAPDWFASISHPASLWGDVKVYEDAAYAVTETSGTGIQVIDMSNIDNHVVTLVRTITLPSTNHNIAVDTTSGYLYTCGSGGGSASTVVFDLSNPTDPVEVGTWTGAYEHDAQIITYLSGPYTGRQILFGASEGRGLDVVDVTDKSNTFLVSRTPYPNVAYCHQLWTEDLQYVYINDELDSITRTTVFDISDIDNPVMVGEFSAGTGAIEHNNYVRDGFLYEANYHSGLRIFNLNCDPVQPPQIGWFDTYPEDDGNGFDGAWSCYPFFPSGTVIVSDLDRGLFVLDVSEALATEILLFEYPQGQPQVIDPAGGTSVRVEVMGACDSVPEPGTGLLHYDVGGGFVSVPMEVISPNIYDAVFPAVDCLTEVSYYVSAETSNQTLLTDPPDAPATTYSTVAATDLVVAFEDNFETDLGWTVLDSLGLGDGTWDRGVPVDCNRGDPPTDSDGSGQCYLTDNSAAGGCNSDVDDGYTYLVSPTIDLSDGDAEIHFSLWYTNNDGGDPNNDLFKIYVSNLAVFGWTLVETVGPTTSAGWTEHSFRVSDYVVPDAGVQLRFEASDLNDASVVEAAVDAVSVVRLVCDVVPTCSDEIQNQGEDRIDCGGPCPPCDCLSDAECDDSAFCTGVETCDAFGHCQPGTDPCPDPDLACDEQTNACTCIPSASGDVNGDGNANGVDIQVFVDGILGSPSQAATCRGDFNGNTVLDVGDIDGMVIALLAP